MMEELSKCVRQEVQRLVPISLLHEVTCFIFNEKHPLDSHCYDIIVCTGKGEVIELLHREPVFSISLRTPKIPIKIDLFRNTKNIVYLLVATTNELFIINRDKDFSLMRKIQNYRRYIIDDSTCSGISTLQVWCSDDALPLKFNEELEIIEDMLLETNSIDTDCSPLFITSLKVKLNQAKYAVSYSKKLYEDILHLRHKAAFFGKQHMHPNHGAALFQDIAYKAQTQLRLVQDIWVKMCNLKVIMALDISNESNETINDLDVILHGDTSLINYQYTIFEQTSLPPYWKRLHENVSPKSQATIALVVDVEELKRLFPKSDVKGVITYTVLGKEYLLPISKISISLVDLLDEKFDVLSNSDYGTKEFLAILSTTEKNEISFLLPHNDSNDDVDMGNLFRTYLKMQKIPNSDVVIHRDSPYHPLNGVMIWFDNEKKESTLGTVYFATAYTRCSSQLMLLMKYMYDAIPYRLLLVPRGIKISSRTLNKQICIDNDFFQDYSKNVIDFGKSLFDQMTLILKYYDRCIIQMGDSNNQQVLETIGEKIDLFINGKEQFYQFNGELNKSILKSIKCLKGQKTFENVIKDVMVVDD